MAEDADKPASNVDAQPASAPVDDGFADLSTPAADEPKAADTAPEDTPEQKAPEAPADEPKSTDDDPAGKSKDQPAEDKPADEPDAPDDPKERNRQGYAERQRIKREAQQQFADATRGKSADELEAEGLSKAEALIEAHKQELAQRDFIDHVSDLTSNVQADATSLETEFKDFMQEGGQYYDKDWLEQVSRDYIRDAELQMDPSNQFVLSARLPMYDYFKSRINDRKAGIQLGQVAGQKDAERNLASAEALPATPPPASSPDDDPFLRGFDNPYKKS